MKPLTARQKAARKGVRTRMANRAAWKRWEEIDKPARLQEVAVLNALILASIVPVRVEFMPLDGGPKLKKGTGYGTLLNVLGTGISWRVLPDGYVNPREWHARFWRVV